MKKQVLTSLILAVILVLAGCYYQPYPGYHEGYYPGYGYTYVNEYRGNPGNHYITGNEYMGNRAPYAAFHTPPGAYSRPDNNRGFNRLQKP